MNRFTRLFGKNESEIKEACVLLPFLPKDIAGFFGAKEFTRGKLYATANTAQLTLIHTGIGATLAGDAVLYLEKTPCRDIFLFGACGLAGEIQELKTGSMVSPLKCYAIESFSQILQKHIKCRQIFYPDKTLWQELFRLDKAKTITPVTCASFGSLKLEEEKRNLFIKQGIDVVDMECSAIFAAAQYIRRRALALLYVTDIIGVKPFYAPLSPQENSALNLAIKRGVEIIIQLSALPR